ncbi:MAG TPA: hypothetical protein VFW71_03320 [Actinomycetota bacterium]|nr:hypothetical protein [Actinomycetota bacterium]
MTAADDAPAAPDLDAVLEELRARAYRRRASGAYPPGLEHDLDVHFRHIVEHRPVRDLDSLHEAMATFEQHLTFDAAGIPTGSQVPGGELLHRSVSKVVTRQTGWLARELQDFAESVRVILWKMIETLDSPTHVHSELTAELDAVLDRLAYYERAPADAAMLGSILQRLEALEAGGAGPAAPGGPDIAELTAALKGCSPLLALGAAPWIPVLLGALAPDGADARAAAAAELAAAGEGSLGAVVLADPVPGAPEAQLRITAAALRPGGKLVVDGAPPLHPAELAFEARQAGFTEVAVTWRPAAPAPPVAWLLVATR